MKENITITLGIVSDILEEVCFNLLMTDTYARLSDESRYEKLNSHAKRIISILIGEEKTITIDEHINVIVAMIIFNFNNNKK